MLRQALIGIAYGAAIGILNNWLLFRSMGRAKKRGEEVLRGVGRVLGFRLVIVGVALVTVMRWPVIAIATATSAIVIGFVELMLWYKRKGGVIE